MNKYSVVIAGLLVSAAGSALASFGFSESCSNEIVAKSLPLIGSLPGLLMAYIGRVRQGDVKLSGFKK